LNTANQDERYEVAVESFRGAIERLARAYEVGPEERRDLVQDIHLALWRSFAVFDERCSLRTWVYRVAHNTAASHAAAARRLRSRQLVSLEEVSEAPSAENPEQEVADDNAVKQLMQLIHQLKQPDRQIVLLHLEDLSAAEIGEIAGLSPGAVRTKIHRLKAVLARRYKEGGGDGH
jgi:RNA polymerase sigma-70 factor (ECF subfamily)